MALLASESISPGSPSRSSSRVAAVSRRQRRRHPSALPIDAHRQFGSLRRRIRGRLASFPFLLLPSARLVPFSSSRRLASFPFPSSSLPASPASPRPERTASRPASIRAARPSPTRTPAGGYLRAVVRVLARGDRRGHSVRHRRPGNPAPTSRAPPTGPDPPMERVHQRVEEPPASPARPPHLASRRWMAASGEGGAVLR